MSYTHRKFYLLGFIFINIFITTAQDGGCSSTLHNHGGCSSTLDENSWVKKGRSERYWSDKLIKGERWTFDCRLSSNDVNATLVQKYNEKCSQRIPDGKHVKVLDKNMFLISGVNMSDKGSYYCKACGLEKFVGKLTIIKDQTAYDKPNVTKTPDTEISAYGSTVTLSCEVGGEYMMKWHKIGFTGDLNVSHSYKVKYVIPSVTEKDDGKYMCEIQRAIVSYTANSTIVVKSQASEIPSFSEFNASTEIISKDNDDIFLNYSVSGLPYPDIKWYKSINGLTFKEIAKCPRHVGQCEQSSLNGKITITKHSFSISKIEYAVDHNTTYICKATSEIGKANKSFTIRVYIKPKLKEVKERSHFYQKGIQLNCSVEQVNPKKIEFIWQYCNSGKSTCNPKNDTMWEAIKEDHMVTKTLHLFSFLVLEDQPQGKIVYRCEAKNFLGSDHILYNILKVPGSFKRVTSKSPVELISTIAAVGMFTLSLIAVIAFLLCKRIKLYGGLYVFSYPPMPDYIEKLDCSKDIREQIQKLPYVPEWEFPKEKISLLSELGKGEFGSVWLANASGITEFHPRNILKQKLNRTRLSVLFRTLTNRSNGYVIGKEVSAVAVKRLKDQSDREKLADLRSELKILIHVGEHENIVNLLGACTKGASFDLWIIMEYCANGDLQSFLRRNRSVYKENDSEVSLAIDLAIKFGPRDLIHIALQIARGMEFLISRKVIHRDLAARNVLLGNGYIAKVADFGLARDVYKYKKYVKKSSALLPLKWMAIESIQYSVFTEKTDVWSYGIVLWELFTLGQTPYPDVPNLDVFSYLLEGERMAIPTRCPSKISNLMKQCWEDDSINRPSFTMIVKMLEGYVSNERNFQNISPNNLNCVSSDLKQVETDDEEIDSNLKKPEYLQVIFVGDEKNNALI